MALRHPAPFKHQHGKHMVVYVALSEEELDALLNAPFRIKETRRETPEAASTHNAISFPPYGSYIMVKNYNPQIVADEVYCPRCGRSYPLNGENFIFKRKAVFQLKPSDYVRCKACKISRWISLDPTFGLKLTLEELAAGFRDLAKSVAKGEIAENLTSKRANNELVCRKTVVNGFERLAPMIYRYTIDCCKPRIVDKVLVMDTTYFTRKISILDENYVTRRRLAEAYATIMIGQYSKGIYGMGIAYSVSESARQCVTAAMNYTSGALRECKVKYDGDDEIGMELINAGVPKEYLISIPKTEYKGGINEIEEAFSHVKQHIPKHRFSLKQSIFQALTAFIVQWNFFDKHSLFDGRYYGKIAQLLRIENAPSDWVTLIQQSWRYIISRGDLFNIYYPKYNRGAHLSKVNKPT